MKSRLFYLEDDQVLAHITIKAFIRQGFEVVHFENVGDARHALNQSNYSHAMLDMKLSDGNSLSLVSDLVSAQAEIKILLLTGYSSIATAVQAIKLGAHNYLAKPASIEEVMAAFNEQLDTHAPPAETISLKRLEWEKIQQALIDNNGNISATARQLKMHRRTLQRKLDKRPVSG